MTFTCSESNLTVIKWKVEPYTEDIDLRYAPLFMIEDPGMLMIESIDGVLLAKLVNFTRINEKSANMTTTLTVATSGVTNGTNITCITIAGSETSSMNAAIYFAGLLSKVLVLEITFSPL